MSKDYSKPKTDAKSLIEQLASAEEQFVSRPFIAACRPGGEVHIKINGVRCRIKVAPTDFEGIGVFHPVSFNEAILEREATLIERKQYLDLFPAVHLIAARRSSSGWMGTAANRGDTRFQIDGMVPIQLASEIRQFDVLLTRFDGSTFWFEQIDARTNPRHADYLRNQLEKRLAPGQLDFSGLSAEHRAVYELNYWVLMQPPQSKANLQSNESDQTLTGDWDSGDLNESRLRESLSHAGALLVGYLERNDSFQVSYIVNGQQHTSAVHKDNLSLISAGVCLDGLDADFDLTSLVGVLNKGMSTGQIHQD